MWSGYLCGEDLVKNDLSVWHVEFGMEAGIAVPKTNTAILSMVKEMIKRGNRDLYEQIYLDKLSGCEKRSFVFGKWEKSEWEFLKYLACVKRLKRGFCFQVVHGSKPVVTRELFKVELLGRKFPGVMKVFPDFRAKLVINGYAPVIEAVVKGFAALGGDVRCKVNTGGVATVYRIFKLNKLEKLPLEDNGGNVHVLQVEKLALPRVRRNRKSFYRFGDIGNWDSEWGTWAIIESLRSYADVLKVKPASSQLSCDVLEVRGYHLVVCYFDRVKLALKCDEDTLRMFVATGVGVETAKGYGCVSKVRSSRAGGKVSVKTAE